MSEIQTTVESAIEPTDACAPTTSLSDFTFDNRFVDELPGDPIVGSELRQVIGAVHSRVRPLRVPSPRLVAWSEEMASELGLGSDVYGSSEGAEVLTGTSLLPGSDPHAMNYGGHQFGSWAGQLGDGRAIALGEVLDRNGDHQTLQLKGAGPTPYSRRADGLAVLRSSVREFLCSEAMFHLGVPTTRALSLAVTGNDVIRDMLYDGNPAPEPGAIVCRVAPSFLRFGTYQLPAARGDEALLRQVVDFTITNYFAELGEPSVESYVAWFEEVCRTTSEMIVEWMRVGFVHGVMNTDNMSIHGLTIDYGPYGWVDDYDRTWTPNTTDAAGRRYRFGHQPAVAQWNLLQLANAIYPLIADAEPLERALNGFVRQYDDAYRLMMLGKLGLAPTEQQADDSLIEELLDVLELAETDMTIFFRRLATIDRTTDDLSPEGLGDAYYDPAGLNDEARRRIGGWLADYRTRLERDDVAASDRVEQMNAVNPCYVLRNYLAQQAIDKAEAGDYSEIANLLDLMRAPYTEQAGCEAYAGKRPDWARDRPGCSMLSCSS